MQVDQPDPRPTISRGALKCLLESSGRVYATSVGLGVVLGVVLLFLLGLLVR